MSDKKVYSLGIEHLNFANTSGWIHIFTNKD
jgi:hypothetical protein